MVLQINAETAPITMNKDGVALVGGTRVRLETIITAFHQGDSAEQIADDFDAITLADVYAVIAYYLNHRDEVDAYIQQQEDRAEQVRLKIEANQPQMFSLRARMLARKARAR